MTELMDPLPHEIARWEDDGGAIELMGDDPDEVWCTIWLDHVRVSPWYARYLWSLVCPDRPFPEGDAP